MQKGFAETAENIDQLLSAFMAAGADDCGLKRLVSCEALPIDLRTSINTWIQLGFTLRGTLPQVNRQLLVDWLGSRLILIHHAQLARANKWTGIVGSRLDRTIDDFSLWPQWIERAVHLIARDAQTLLLVPGTTTAAILEPLAYRANLNCLKVHLPTSTKRDAVAIGKWFLQTINSVAVNDTRDNTQDATAAIWLSSECSPAGQTESELDFLPLRDRAIFALAHRLIALSVRPQGNVAKLLTMRLHDERFPLGTVSIRLPNGQRLSDDAWLEQHAIGWYLPTRSPLKGLHGLKPQCKPRVANGSCQSALTQWTTNAQLWRDESDYLVHCVRGDDGAAFRKGQPEAVIDAVIQGNPTRTTAFESLLKVIDSRRLRASGKLLRTGTCAVSLTGVPLKELIRRRKFQAHLGRWDWESFGLMIRREALEPFGVRPVIYGDEDLYKQLDMADRPFFQPARRRSARSEQDHWQAEKEWRLLSDVHLSELPPQSLILFVETADQAQYLAAHCPWPVIWQTAIQTPPTPVSAKHRRRSYVRTNKN